MIDLRLQNSEAPVHMCRGIFYLLKSVPGDGDNGLPGHWIV